MVHVYALEGLPSWRDCSVRVPPTCGQRYAIAVAHLDNDRCMTDRFRHREDDACQN